MPAHRAESPLTVRRRRLGPLARGVRGDPPLQPQPPESSPHAALRLGGPPPGSFRERRIRR
jgi:hypothetical protein